MGLWEDAPTRMRSFPPAQTLDEANAQIKELQNLVAIAFKNIENIVNGNIDSRNTREIGGWKIDLTEMKSKDGDVGMSTEDTPADDVRFWAGSADKDTAPWRVLESGKMHATGAVIESASGYPKIIIDPDNNIIGAYTSPDNFVLLQPINSVTDAPAFYSAEGSSEIALGFGAGSAARAGLYSSDQFEFRMPNGVLMPLSLFTDWTIIRNLQTTRNLQEDLDSKAGSGNSTGLAGADFRDGGIPIGTQLLKAGGGSVAWAGISIPNHQHTQF